MVVIRKLIYKAKSTIHLPFSSIFIFILLAREIDFFITGNILYLLVFLQFSIHTTPDSLPQFNKTQTIIEVVKQLNR